MLVVFIPKDRKLRHVSPKDYRPLKHSSLLLEGVATLEELMESILLILSPWAANCVSDINLNKTEFANYVIAVRC